MAKRFTDTEKWGRPWFAELPLLDKLIWLYILDECDHGGIWHANLKRLNGDLDIADDARITREHIERVFAKQLRKVGDYYFIPSFIEFQYKLERFEDLNPENLAHGSVIQILRKHGIGNFPSPAPRTRSPRTGGKPLPSPFKAPTLGSKEKDKEQETESETERDQENLDPAVAKANAARVAEIKAGLSKKASLASHGGAA